jgi:virulence factor Mce-like protein
MQKQAPSLGRILTMVLFALSCFGLLTFLWLTFGGPTPLKPKGYRVNVPFKEAGQLAIEADVRISGVPVGKVKSIEANAEEGRSDVELEIEPQYAPLPKNVRVQLRSKSLLGENYLELTPGEKNSGFVPDGGELDEGGIESSVELDEILRSLDKRTRAAFGTWQQQLAIAGAGRGREIGEAFSQLAPLEQEAAKLARVLNKDDESFSRLIRNTGVTFAALSQNQEALRSLIRNTNSVFETTATRDQQLAETFVALPTFQRESRATLRALGRFSDDVVPVLEDPLIPVAQELSPTFEALEALSPDLRDFILDLGPATDASVDGLPAADEFLEDFAPFIGALDPALTQLNPLLQYLNAYQDELPAFFANIATSTQATLGSAGLHYLRTMQPLSPLSLGPVPSRTKSNRTSPYMGPGAFRGLASGLPSLETRQCQSGISPGLAPVGSVPDTAWYTESIRNNLLRYAFGNNPANVAAPPCKQQAPSTVSGRTTLYPQLAPGATQAAPKFP